MSDIECYQHARSVKAMDLGSRSNVTVSQWHVDTLGEIYRLPVPQRWMRNCLTGVFVGS